MSAEHLEYPTIGGLAQLQSSAAFGKARSQDSELAEPGHDLVGNLGLAIDRHRIDLGEAKLPHPLDQFVRLAIDREIGIGEQFAAEVPSEVKSLGKTDAVGAIAEQLFGFLDLLFAIHRHPSMLLSRDVGRNNGRVRLACAKVGLRHRST